MQSNNTAKARIKFVKLSQKIGTRLITSAVVLFSQSSLEAAKVVTTTGNVKLSAPSVNFDQAFASGDTISIGGDGHTITVDALQPAGKTEYTIGAIVVNKNLGGISVSHNCSIGTVDGTATGAAMSFASGNTKVTLTGTAGENNQPLSNSYNKLTNIDFNNTNSRVRVSDIFGIPVSNASKGLMDTYFSFIATHKTIGDTNIFIVSSGRYMEIQAKDTNLAYDIGVSQDTLVLNAENSVISGNLHDHNKNTSLQIKKSALITTKTINAFFRNINIDTNQTLTIQVDGCDLSANNCQVDFKGVGATLNMVGSNMMLGNFLEGTNGILNIQGDTSTADPSIITVKTINIADSKSMTIDAINGNMNLLNNNTSINFGGSNAALVLTNSGNTDHQFTLFTNLNPSDTTDNYGIVRVGATTKGIMIANNNEAYSIGKDNTHRLQDFIVERAGSIVVDNTVFTKLLSMNSTGQVKFNQALDLGADGSIAFGASGTLIASKGITGNIDFAGKEASLIFNGDAGGDEWYTLDGTISNAGGATLEVDTKLKVIDKGVGEIKTINIGKNGILSISSNNPDLILINTADGSINFADAATKLVLSAAQDQTIKLNGIIDGFDKGGENIVLDGNGHNLTLTMSDNVSLGTNGKKLDAINISGHVIFDKSISANVLSLNISHNGSLVNYSTKSSLIDSINIGDEQGAGEYIRCSKWRLKYKYRSYYI